MNRNICFKSLYETCHCPLNTHLVEHLPVIDSHCHVDLFASDRSFFSSLSKSSIRRIFMINNKHNYTTWNTTFDISYQNCGVFECFGIHPKILPEDYEFVFRLNQLENILKVKNNYLSGSPVVGVGETGLDETSRFDMHSQKLIFAQQVRIAKDYQLPLILHCRGKEYFRPMLDCLLSILPSSHYIQWHCVKADSDLEVIDYYLKKFPNSFISLNRSSTLVQDIDLDKRFKKWLRNYPLLFNRLVLETDCPWLCPKDLSKEDYNPATGIFITSKWIENVIRCSGKNASKIIEIANDNAKRLFKLNI
ncbi:unnamed protein product [Rotaria sp. Silwood2]|nr:unnamed protein product [Rotaria sp. Silwood2]CAF3211159.1 unnamed protein product [Rotaria sp. Silwood2]CAF3502499.1 unnamed protein product [Rotaria sp. Silwood2]CAF4539127.1 unnamed protein product [Rotaria sp. Silwood2]CAF4593240.1 unnamed protein product [Rotaria sp. Silwood2]